MNLFAFVILSLSAIMFPHVFFDDSSRSVVEKNGEVLLLSGAAHDWKPMSVCDLTNVETFLEQPSILIATCRELNIVLDLEFMRFSSLHSFYIMSTLVLCSLSNSNSSSLRSSYIQCDVITLFDPISPSLLAIPPLLNQTNCKL